MSSFYLTHPECCPDYEDEDDDLPSVEDGGTGLSYRCLEPGCDWTGKNAYQHHAEDHHRIVLRDAASFGPVAFTCCKQRYDEEPLTPQDVAQMAARMEKQ